jgi:hypothetical protein
MKGNIIFKKESFVKKGINIAIVVFLLLAIFNTISAVESGKLVIEKYTNTYVIDYIIGILKLVISLIPGILAQLTSLAFIVIMLIFIKYCYKYIRR